MKNKNEHSKGLGITIRPSQMTLPGSNLDYLYRYEKTLFMMEQGLHTGDDPKNIALDVLEVCRDFYDADWCGMVTADVESGVFYPVWWANRDKNRTTTLFDEVEYMDNYAHWINALRDNQPVMLGDISGHEAPVSVNEQQHYARMNVHSVLGWPLYYHRPFGFLILKNPGMFSDQISFLSAIGYVIMNCWKEQQHLEALRLQVRTPCGALKEDRDIYFKLFGEPELHTLKGEVSAETLNSPKLWRLLCYLVIRQRAVPLRTIAEKLYPGEDTENSTNALRVVMFRTKPQLESVLDQNEVLIKRSDYGYQINAHYHVMTDLEEFEKIAAAAKKQRDRRERIEARKNAVKLYSGPLYREASAEHWLLSTVERYAMIYIDTINSLLKDLAELKDYESIQHFASKSLDIEPGNPTAAYWLIISLSKIGLQQNAKAEFERARQYLTESALAELVEKMHEFERSDAHPDKEPE